MTTAAGRARGRRLGTVPLLMLSFQMDDSLGLFDEEFDLSLLRWDNGPCLQRQGSGTLLQLLPGGASGPPFAPFAPGLPLQQPQPRCLDASHAAGCQRCASLPPLPPRSPHAREAEARPEPRLGHAPSDAKSSCTTAPGSLWEFSAYELVGDAGKRNGEKKLRSQLTRTPEWCSVDDRAAASVALRAASPRCADALRARSCSKLCKDSLMLLLGHWSYRSDLWRRRSTRGLSAALCAAPAQLLVAPDVSLIHTHVRNRLEPLSMEAARMQDAAAAARFAQELAGVRDILENISSAWLPSMVAVLFAIKAAEMQAASLMTAHPPALASVERLMEQLVDFGVFHVSQMTSSIARLKEPGTDAVETIWVSESLAAQQTALEVFVRQRDMLARFRASQPLPEYIRSAAAVMEAASSHIMLLLGAYRAKADWLSELPQPAGRTPLNDPACRRTRS